MYCEYPSPDQEMPPDWLEDFLGATEDFDYEISFREIQDYPKTKHEVIEILEAKKEQANKWIDDYIETYKRLYKIGFIRKE